MSLFDDEKPKKPATHELGCDLTFMSADELQARITLLKYEIDRLQAEAESKISGRKAAEICSARKRERMNVAMYIRREPKVVLLRNEFHLNFVVSLTTY